MKILLVAFLLLSIAGHAQQGCTDPQALNYSVSATINDGSCIYPITSLPVTTYTNLLSPLLNECSGIVHVDGKLWVQLDNTALSLYNIDSVTPTVFDSVAVLNTVNTDWEEIATDSTFLYIGDVGNNFGNRTNLHLLRLPLTSLDSVSVLPDSISFSYSDQTTFISSLNNTPFDCESFFIYNDSVHLFTKDWVTKWTKHYVMPSLPGVHVAELVDSMNTGGLITSADILNDSIIVLLGYNIGGASEVFIWMLSDFPPGQFFSGNKRKLTCGPFFTIGQTEGVILNKDLTGFITNENVQSVVLPQLKKFDLNPYFTQTTSVLNAESFSELMTINNNQLIIRNPGNDVNIYIFNETGQQVLQQQLTGNVVSLANLRSGIYYIRMISNKNSVTMPVFIPSE